MLFKHGEFHRVERIGWLRAAVLGANDGIISTASLLIGVAAAQTTHAGILVAGSAAIAAGAMSMAAGDHTIAAVFTMSIVFLSLLGTLAAKVGGSGLLKGAARVALWGTLAMLVTAAIGSVLGVAV